MSKKKKKKNFPDRPLSMQILAQSILLGVLKAVAENFRPQIAPDFQIAPDPVYQGPPLGFPQDPGGKHFADFVQFGTPPPTDPTDRSKVLLVLSRDRALWLRNFLADLKANQHDDDSILFQAKRALDETRFTDVLDHIMKKTEPTAL